MIKIRERCSMYEGFLEKDAREVPAVPGAVVEDYIPERFRRMKVVNVKLNSRVLDNEQIRTIEPKPGDVISLTPWAGEFLIGAAVAVVTGFLLRVGEYHYNRYQAKQKRHAQRRAEVGPSYGFDIMQDTYEDGASEPVIMGRMRGGGIVVSQYTDAEVEGVDRYNLLLAAGAGPINAISDVHIEGNDAANYSGVTIVTALGTNTQNPLAGFERTPVAQPLNQQLLPGTPIVTGGITPADAWKIKINYPDGLYKEEHDGSFGSLYWLGKIRYRTTAGPGAWSGYLDFGYHRRRMTPFSIWPGGDFPALDTYDLEVTGETGASQGRYHTTAYLKEYQEIANSSLCYRNIALLGVKAVGTDQLSGGPPRVTALYEGIVVNGIASGSAVSAAAFTRRPAELMLASIFNRVWGLGNEVDTTVECTMTATAGNFTVGETVLGPASVYQFRGLVEAWDSGTRKLTVECQHGMPYGTLTGQTSMKSADVSSIDNCYGVDLPSFYALRTWNAEQVYDRKDMTFVNIDSLTGTNKLYVDDNTGWTWGAPGEHILIGYQTAREEEFTVSGFGTDGTGDYILLGGNLAYDHLAADADTCIHSDDTEDRHAFNFIFDGRENKWSALERIARAAQAMLILVNGTKIAVRALKNDTPVQLVCQGNVRMVGEGEAAYSSLSVEFPETGDDLPNRLVADYLDEDDDYAQRIVTIELPEAYTNGEKIHQARMDLLGATSARQVHDLAWYHLKRLRHVGKPIQFLMWKDAIDFQVGDPFWFQHDIPGYGVAGGHVVSSTASTVTLDQPATISGGESIRIRHLDDTQEAQAITSPAGTHLVLTIAGTWTSNPAEGEIYAIGDCARYRCVGLRWTQGLDIEVQAESDPEALYDPNPNAYPVSARTTLPDADEMPPDVQNLTLTEGTQLGVGQGIVNFIEATWTRPEHNSYSCATVFMTDLSDALVEVGKAGWGPGTGTSPPEFDRPRGLCVSGLYLYVADERNNRIFKLDRYTLAHVAHSTTALDRPWDVATDGTYLYVADSGAHKIRTLLCSDLSLHATFGGPGAGNGQFNWPLGICTDGSSVWVCDTMNHRIQRLTAAAGVLAYSAQVGSIGAGDANFDRPFGIDVEGAYIFIADGMNDRIKKHDKGGAMGYVAQFGSTGTDAGEFDRPIDVEVDGSGNIFVADYANHRIQKFDSTFTHLDTWGTAGIHGAGPDLFYYPRGLAHHSGGTLFVAEFGNCRVQSRHDEALSLEDWVEVGTADSAIFRITGGITPGKKYRVAVASTTRNGTRKAATDAPYAEIVPTATGTTPPAVTGFSAVRVGGQVRLYWTPVAFVGLLGYEVRAGADWQTGRPVLSDYPSTEAFVNAAPVHGSTSKYWIKAISASRVYSSSAASVTIDTPWVGLIAGQNLTATAGVNLRTS